MSFLPALAAPASPPQSHPPAPHSALPAPHSIDPVSPDASIARQKAAFVAEVFSLAKSKSIPQRDAAAIVASRTEQWNLLSAGGKRGASLIAGKRAWHNYRSWFAKLGKLEGTRKPDASNWRALLPAYAGSRDYVRPGDPRFWVVLARLYENPNQLSLQYAYDLAVAATESELPPESVPTCSACRHYYDRHADRKAVAIARNGEEWYRNNIAGYISRAAPEPDQIWIGDHHIFDCAVRIQDPESGQWRPVRPWLTGWMDWGTLWMHGKTIRPLPPNRDAIERSLREGLAGNDGHPPVHLYIDNGKDYKALGFSRPIMDKADEDRVASVCQALACEVHFALPYNARAKVIERIFGIVCGKFSKLWPSYRGRSPEHRPAQASHYWNHPELLPTLEEFVAKFDQWLALVYHDAPSKGRILKGKSPLQARADIRRLRPRLEPMEIYRAFLRELPGKPRKIMRGGFVNALRREYRSDALFQLLSKHTHVRVKVDPDDISTVWIYTLDGREVGPATCKPVLAPVTDDDPVRIEQLREEQRRHQRQVRDAKTVSAANRALPRWTNLPQAAIPAGRRAALAPVASSRPEPCSIQADPALERELESVLRTQSATRLSGAQDEPIDEDLAFLDQLNTNPAPFERWQPE